MESSPRPAAPNQSTVNAQALLLWLKQAAARIVGIKTREFMANLNLLLKILQDAGYDLSELQIEAGFSPQITIHLKPGASAQDEKLEQIIREHQRNTFVSTILKSLLHANHLRRSVAVETLDLQEVTIELKRSPNITLQWKERAAGVTLGRPVLTGKTSVTIQA